MTRRALILFQASLGLGIAIAQPCLAGTLYSNFGPGETFVLNNVYETGVPILATTFVATGSGHLGSVLIPIFTFDSPLSFALYGDAGGQPGTLLESWTLDVPLLEIDPRFTFASVVQPMLSAGTPYWFEITQTERFQTAWHPNNQGIDGGVFAGDDLSQLLHFVPDSPAPAIELDSTEPAPVPEPAPAPLLSGGVLMIAFRRVIAGRFSARVFLFACLACALHSQTLPNLFPFPNGSGLLETNNSANSGIDLSGPFFQSLGTNGRSCGSCHRPAQGWTISAAEVSLRFELTLGLDPIFRPNDGSNCDHNIDTSTVSGRRRAYSLLTQRGLIRIALPMPANAEFNVVSVANPYGCSDATTLSMYRRPLPSTNLRFLSTLMWDGRESSTQTGTQKIAYPTNPGDLLFDLAHQAVDATNGHAQGSTPLTVDQQQAIVNFEMRLTTAQIYDYKAGLLNSNGAEGGATIIATTTMPKFYVGINDPLGGNPLGGLFTPVIFHLFDAWSNPRISDDNNGNDVQSVRARIARGQTLFNSKPIAITGVAGLNDDLNAASIPGTCGTCHDSPNIGNHSVSAPLNIGVGDLTSPLDLSYLPVITLQNKTTQEIKRTTDPGRALITGLWKDVGRLKGPILRGLASRAPYFHNGSAGSLSDVVEFYDKRFNVGFTAQEKKDLIAFLSTL